MSMMRRVGCALLCLSVVVLSGCYSRVKLKTKHTPATTKIYSNFKVDSGLISTMRAQSKNNKVQVDAARQAGVRMTAQLRADLLKNKIALPVQHPKKADLILTGTFRSGTGVVLDWQLTTAKDGTTVLAGSKTDLFFTGNMEPFADDVLSNMLTIDVDQFGSGQAIAAIQKPATGVGLPPAPGAGTDGSKAYAVVIGIDKYREKLPAASHAEADARAFAEYAQKTLGVPEAHIRVLTGQRAGRGDMQSMLEEWLPRNARQPGGKVYVFFSGHGAPDPETGDAYLVPWDADPAYIKTRGISVKGLYSTLESLKGQQVYVFLDACFSGSGDRSVIAQGTRPLVPVKAPQAKGSLIALTASAAKETTGAARDASHGLFTRHLLAGMGGAADANKDGNVSLAELAEHVKANVSRDARLDNREQNPSLIVGKGIQPDSHVLIESLKK
jgi:hypothetical protein